VLALMGDTSDNVPGVRGIGEKTAVKLVQEHGGVAEILEKAARAESPIVPPKLREKLVAGKADAEMSLALVRIDANVPLKFEFDALKLGPRDETRLAALFRDLNFTTLLAEVTTVKATTEQHDYRIVRTDDELVALAGRLQAAPLYAVDTETTDLDPLRSE